MSAANKDVKVGLRGRLINLPVALYIASVVLVFLPSRMAERVTMSNPIAFIFVLTFTLVFFWIKLGKKGGTQQAKDIATVIFVFFLLWEAITTKLDWLPYIFVPAPENVFYSYIQLWDYMLSGLARSLYLLLTGFIASLVIGVSLGIAVGWLPRLRQAVFPIAKAISTVPAIVYGPYIVVIMPTFTAASILVIFFGTFWSTFMNMINRVGTIDARIINTAKVLNVNTRTMLFHIIMPYTLPRIINDMSVALSISMMTLTFAEMIGADRGIGYFVRRSLDYANYTQAFAGIFFIAVVITVLQVFITVLKKKLIKWDY
ncbi:MAG: ABC transporter permease subunit [Clostridiales Family XIII bacterium]|nr:ABC transporter permease subunit [Clostridiales Family XIII bacterium]